LFLPFSFGVLQECIPDSDFPLKKPYQRFVLWHQDSRLLVFDAGEITRVLNFCSQSRFSTGLRRGRQFL